ncbi:LacI family DNA-binding transcriptional regulator [Phototrophicus methaneseepsis]|uniref:LacI family DNA-binding transcriptional regulator n=1 Tax=Phototrophicus methaneseepsis TaxID=2710758 RepID=A0A7S8IFQ5_9CHLR|nr:LacI family DNA-binding transcriptional regulator [Phototrophicus methaneseepsis]QPC83851.1 LacI family DNA-binding transcriptional regulator [Phototrophicus methaneseepsis]
MPVPASRRSRPTILDVASLAGVSYQTVSRVINNHPYVSEDTRKRVQAAIDELGYRPNKAAINLRAKSSKIIAIILYGGWLYGPNQVALNVEMAAKTSGFDVIMSNITEPQQQLMEALQHVKDWMVDGIVLILPARGAAKVDIQSISGDIPIVQIDSFDIKGIPSINFSEAAGTRLIAQHLIDTGHQAFCEISGPLNWHGAQIRHETLLQVCKENGIAPPIHMEGNWATPSGYQAARRIIEQGHQFTAVIAANDNMALGAYRALHQAGLSVPDDVSVVGYDDIPEAAYYTPPLTTIRQNFIELGNSGFDYLLQIMDEPGTRIRQQLVEPKLIIRESTRSI